jgi:hypothetical protein
MAQTAISGGSMQDQISLEGTGSGSGLLDLTRESDDTSLGAELLDEIAPTGTKRGTKAGTGAMSGSAGGSAAGTAAGGTAIAPAIGRGGRVAGEPIFVERADPMAPLFGGAALGAAVMLIFGCFALISAILDTRPGLLDQISNLTRSSGLITAGIGLGLVLVFAVVGKVLGGAVK